ncbi:MAG: gamma-butyrobetaine hydroxylase-like domain-containing protein [Candidatus Competibacterales bacterium]
MSTPNPLEIKLHQTSRVLEVSFDDGQTFQLPCEYLRVFSPSADVRGHGPGQEVLQVGKEGVNIRDIEPVGHYAVRLVFDDGHSTGLYTWDYLFELGSHYEANWRDYLERLAAAGYRRAPDPS